MRRSTSTYGSSPFQYRQRTRSAGMMPRRSRPVANARHSAMFQNGFADATIGNRGRDKPARVATPVQKLAAGNGRGVAPNEDWHAPWCPLGQLRVGRAHAFAMFAAPHIGFTTGGGKCAGQAFILTLTVARCHRALAE